MDKELEQIFADDTAFLLDHPHYKTALLAWRDTAIAQVIGVDEPEDKHSWHSKDCGWHDYLDLSDCNCGLRHRNELRAEQRQRLAQLQDKQGEGKA